MNEMWGSESAKGRAPHAQSQSNPASTPLSLRRIERLRYDNSPAFPGDPEMDWQSEPERPKDATWGLPT